jgi:hypothetical protein
MSFRIEIIPDRDPEPSIQPPPSSSLRLTIYTLPFIVLILAHDHP